MAKFSGLKQYSFLRSLCSNLGRACLHPTWHLLGLGSPRWRIPSHAWCLGRLPPRGLSTWHTWTFSQLWLVSRGAQSWGCQAFLRLTPWTGSAISAWFCRPEASHRPAPIQGVGTRGGDCIRCEHWQEWFIGPPRNTTTWTKSLSEGEKGRKMTFLFCLFFIVWSYWPIL